jgi:hypothetical protein
MVKELLGTYVKEREHSLHGWRGERFFNAQRF